MIQVAQGKVLLRDVTEIRSGVGFPQTFQGRGTGDFPFAKVGDISNAARSGSNFIANAPNWIINEELPKLKAKPFPTGTIVFAKIGEAISQNFRVVTTRPMLFDNNVMGVIPNTTLVDTQYLLFYLKTLDFYSFAAKTTVPSIRKTTLEALSVPLPPIDEQHRIAAILDKADAVRRKRQQAIALTEELLRSAFLEMFGDPVTNPKGWHTKRLGDLAQFVGGGTPSRQKAEYYQGDICWATPKDMGVDVLTETEEHITLEAIEQSATKLVGVGSLLVVVKSKILGRKLPIARTIVPTCFGQDLKAIIPHEAAITRYLHRHIKYGEQTLLQLARGVNTEGLTLVHLQNYQVIIPPASEVARFVCLDSVLENVGNKQKALLKKSTDFFNSLLQRAFRGEL